MKEFRIACVESSLRVRNLQVSILCKCSSSRSQMFLKISKISQESAFVGVSYK